MKLNSTQGFLALVVNNAKLNVWTSIEVPLMSQSGMFSCGSSMFKNEVSMEVNIVGI